MKKFVLGVFLFIQAGLAYSQLNTSDISFDLRYPVPVGNNFLNKAFDGEYKGVIDIGVDYSVLKVNNWSVGVLLNASLIKSDKRDLNLHSLSPKVKLDYKIDIGKLSVIPEVGFGYSAWRFHFSSGENFDFSGLTYKGAAKLVLNSSKRLNWYCQVSYEFTKLKKYEDGATNSSYNRNMEILYPGIGVIWKFNNK